MDIPVVTLVGRPNVGKSTLFNRLTRTQDALVSEVPVLTRDRKYGYAKWYKDEFIVIDTGSIEIEDNNKNGEVETHIVRQTLVAIDEADIILFLVDGKYGIIGGDQHIANYLRRLKKKIIIVVNKTDGLDPHSAVSDFHSLGMVGIIPIAASSGRGIHYLLQHRLLPMVRDTILKQPQDQEENEVAVKRWYTTDDYHPKIKFAIVGRPNAGKSTLINRILGEERVIVYDRPGTTRDSISIPVVHNGRKYVLIDTAGVRKRGKIQGFIEKSCVSKTLQAIKECNVVLMIIDASEGVSDQDLSLISVIFNNGRSLVIAVNKWDKLSCEAREKVSFMLKYRLECIKFIRVHFISAMYGNGVSNLFSAVNEAYRSSVDRISSSRLTKIMHIAVNKHQPPLIRNRRVKLKYAHVGGYHPLRIVIHGNQVRDLAHHRYKRYLVNYFHRSLDIQGTPILMQFNEGENPFN